MKIRVTIDLDRAEESMGNLTALETGAFGCDMEGAYRMFYHSRTNLVTFEDVEVIK